jgi:hypothetical protein
MQDGADLFFGKPLLHHSFPGRDSISSIEAIFGAQDKTFPCLQQETPDRISIRRVMFRRLGTRCDNGMAN